jgi:L-rhamnose mutarotase
MYVYIYTRMHIYIYTHTQYLHNDKNVTKYIRHMNSKRHMIYTYSDKRIDISDPVTIASIAYDS